MTPTARFCGPDLTRETECNVARAGFTIVRVRHVYLDVIKTIHAVAPV